MSKEDKVAVKERLLSTGIRLFAEKGYAGSTFRDICEAAGSNIAAINYYFGDKEGFYKAAKEYAGSILRTKLNDLWEKADKDPWEALRMHIDFLLDAAYDDTMFHINRMHLRELIDADAVPRGDTEINADNKRREYDERMSVFLGRLLGPGLDTPENISLLRYTYHSFCLFLPIHRQVEEKYLKGKGRFNVQSALGKKAMADCIFNVVRRTVEDMRSKLEKIN